MKKSIQTLLITTSLIINMSCSTKKDKVTTTEENVNYPLTETYWKLIELNGQKITYSKDKPEVFIIFKSKESLVHGNSGCNNFSGSYSVTNETQLSLSKMVSTMMACEDMSLENEFVQTLERVDNFAIYQNNLSLNKARMAPLARFEAVLKTK